MPRSFSPLALQHLLHRHAGPAGDDGGDLFGVHHFGGQLFGFGLLFGLGQALFHHRDLAVLDLPGLGEVAEALGLSEIGAQAIQGLAGLGGGAELVLLRLPLGGHLVGLELQVVEFDFQLFQAVLGGGVGFALQRLALDLQLHQAAVDLVQRLGLGVHRHADAAGGFVHQVDGLVGQEAVGDVAVGEGGGGDDGAVADPHAVVHLVLLLQAAQDRDGVLHRRFAHEHGLEAAGQRGVLLHIFAVFVQRGGADAVQFAARQGGLQQVGGVHRPVAGARADQRVHLVDEEDDLALGGDGLVQHRLQPLLELAAVFGAGDQAAHVQRQAGAFPSGFRARRR